MNNDVENVSEFEYAEVLCHDCIGIWNSLEVNDNKSKLFTLKAYIKYFQQCNFCLKKTEIYTIRNKK